MGKGNKKGKKNGKKEESSPGKKYFSKHKLFYVSLEGVLFQPMSIEVEGNDHATKTSCRECRYYSMS